MNGKDVHTTQGELYAAATAWHGGLNLTVCGVNVGACLTFPVMQTLVEAESRAEEMHATQNAGEGGGDE